MSLDLSDLADDQLVELSRLVAVEIIRRGGAVEAAARAAVLDEAEKAEISARAAELEAAQLRQAERDAVAAAAREKVRMQNAGKRAEFAQRAAAARDNAERAWLERAAALVGRPPRDLHILYVDTHYGRRVLVNQGDDRYVRDHLVDYNCDTIKISTIRPLIAAKKSLIAYCAEFAAYHPINTRLMAADHHWSPS